MREWQRTGDGHAVLQRLTIYEEQAMELGRRQAARSAGVGEAGVQWPGLWQSFLWRRTNMLGKYVGKVLGFAGFTIQYGCIAHCAFEYLGEIVMCSGPSMEPTIKTYDIIISEKLSRQFYRIEKGDIVIAKSPNNPRMNICKRVIGLEGDKVCTGGPLDVYKSHRYVPKGHVWLEGDNLHNSTDSRNYGPIPYALIRSRACFKIWPPHEFGFLKESPNSTFPR
ncbi:mitochondrial inner membrane protease subunit 1 isoform X1 [Carcharodon carcharias]|uniref:mitochondrial inner membrane protease subunit 1 isoform X1 n=2 Tax=Carcharodon carcharias TaxID=13397 RepID=UPI001B7EBF40|nr:mitochondrial inner membrane protease subunit 1 isoform X1 [Carcharodon carcharias]